ncbi:MAG: chorismate synthase [Clostridia bacterium]|nr:chorismate synthase [Clostridia bacterium]
MSSIYGETIRLSLFGQSHAPAVGMTLDGLPAGQEIDPEKVRAFLRRRAPGLHDYTTARKEPDEPEFLSGIRNGKTCGAPLTAIIRNTDVHPEAYRDLPAMPRPGHADYPAYVRNGPDGDFAGGGHFSGRLTAPLCIAGAICKQFLEANGITVRARILSIGAVRDDSPFASPLPDGGFPTVSPEKGDEMIALIRAVKEEGDSVGGVIECVVDGLPAGIGDPVFDGMENRIAKAVFAIPAVKGIEFGDGFELAGRKGSESNDAYRLEDGKIRTETNRCGGILGGLTDGMPLCFRTAVKPTPSIGKPQKTVHLDNGTETETVVKGRHDPCIVPRAVPCVEAAAAIAVLDAWLSYAGKETGHGR